ncbi:Na+/H+ antiporter subunit E [Pseudogemmobacter faecipullorum]|uniref:Na+/H+ antiporter subunit E n=1 Tax=Pseudogemmobacter faecipullorum TaxID=2755041 RepID=A0ABS8CJ20_9RHOB|nr:Na+/H+ antiporter subunit E [Pseudogemmobacter faecipullorum]MCB5408845.1 Na+/H+ antiporter subunit E [Pseudogemmobacter faecipullorum]
MSRLFPHPLLSLALLLLWLLLNSFSFGHLVLGAVVATLAARAFALIEPDRVVLRRPMALVRLFFIVGYDIIRSNIAVARLIISGGRHGRRHSDFVEIPLRMRNPAPLALLAMIVTATPGTAWLEYDEETGVLLLHVFDLVENQDWIALIGTRYESLLMEAFPG